MGLFEDLTANRRQRVLATHTHGVFRVQRSGVVNKTASVTYRTAAEAVDAAERMEQLNPGKRYIAKPLEERS